jgi:hypothetical protein
MLQVKEEIEKTRHTKKREETKDRGFLIVDPGRSGVVVQPDQRREEDRIEEYSGGVGWERIDEEGGEQDDLQMDKTEAATRDSQHAETSKHRLSQISSTATVFGVCSRQQGFVVLKS